MKRSNNENIIIVIVVDDMKFIRKYKSSLEHLRHQRISTLEIKLFGKLRSFVSWEFDQPENGICISQTRYTEDILQKCGMDKANRVRTSIAKKDKTESRLDHETVLSPRDHATYRSAVGELIYLTVCPGPDISFTIGVLARQVHAPTQRHVCILRKLL